MYSERAAGLPIEVVGFVEVLARYELAQSRFPNAKAYYDIDKVNEGLRDGSIDLPLYDVLICSYPCTDETQLKELCQYGDTDTIHLFLESQHEFVKLAKPDMVLNEVH